MKLTLPTFGATAVLAALVGSTVAIAPAEAARIYFTPEGTQLDSDPVLDLAFRPGDTVNFDIWLDTTGLPKALRAFQYSLQVNGLGGIGPQVPELVGPFSATEDPANPFNQVNPGLTPLVRTWLIGGALGFAPNQVIRIETLTATASQFLNNDSFIDFRIVTDQALGVGNTDFTSLFLPEGQGVEVQLIPTPALLPGLIGMGVAALRRKQKDDQEAEA